MILLTSRVVHPPASGVPALSDVSDMFTEKKVRVLLAGARPGSVFEEVKISSLGPKAIISVENSYSHQSHQYPN